jgi:predicted ester cyclase
MPTGDPAALVRRFYFEVWDQADEQVARDILHPQLSFRGSLGAERSGPDGLIDYLRQTHAALAEYHCIIDDLIATIDRAAARMTFTGIHHGTFFGVAATGQRITWSGAAFFAIADARIKDIWVLGDLDRIKQQLGAVPTAAFGEA